MFLKALMVYLIRFIINSVITCTVPEFDEMASSSCSPGDSVIYNEQCSLSCPARYSRAGPSSVNCTGSGSFSQMFPRCVGKYNIGTLWYTRESF